MKKIFCSLLLAAIAFSVAAQSPLKGKIMVLDFGTAVGERSGSGMSLSLSGLSSNKTVSLLSIERALDAAAKDDKVAMVFLKTDRFSGGPATAEELRHSLERFRKAGKPVVSYATHYDASGYYLASVADKVVMNPAGEGELIGMSTLNYYLGDLLDTLGIQMQLIRHGKYKSAGEPFIRGEMSAENREQYEVLLRSIWNARMSEVAASRKVSVADLDAWVDGLALDKAQTWHEKGLVDELWHKGEMEAWLCTQFGVAKPELLRTVDAADYAAKLKKGPAKNKVAVVYANGSIGEGSDIDGVKMAHEIAKVRADSTVKVIVFRVNSPGGAVLSSDLIRREVTEAQKVKPVVASYGSYAASGGYWISSSADRIFTDNTTLTGSIGVFGLIPALGPAIRKNLKVNMVSVGTHAHSDLGQGMRPLDEQEKAWMQKSVDNTYDQFVSLVAESRKLEKDFVESIAQGRVWAGTDALRLGLADEQGTLLDAIEYAARLKGLDQYRIVLYPEEKSMSLRDLLRGPRKDDEPLVRVELPAALQQQAAVLEEVTRLAGPDLRPATYARMPFMELR